jgi:hypothetical protein
VIKPEQTLRVARFTFPDVDFHAIHDGSVFGRFKDGIFKFDLNNVRDREKAQIKLVSLGWQLKPLTRDGKPYWKATKSQQIGEMGGIAGGPEHSDLKQLIVQLVEIEQAGGEG